MSKNVKIILFLLIGLSMLALIFYGLFYSKKLAEHKEDTVKSNINDYIYDETKDTIDLEDEEEEDFDGDEVTDEDDDFEIYNEEDDWGDETDAPIAAASPKNKKEEDDEEELEELYDNKAPKEEEKVKKEDKKEKTPVVSNTSNGKYMVIVGSFGSERNARKKIKALEKVGFEGEIIQLKKSKLKTVIAGRFAKERNAKKLAEKIEEEGLRAIVKEE